MITLLFIVHIYNYYLYRALDPDKEWSELMAFGRRLTHRIRRQPTPTPPQPTGTEKMNDNVIITDTVTVEPDSVGAVVAAPESDTGSGPCFGRRS
jgi:hypothetical protein